MSLYALTAAGLKGLQATFFGSKIPVGDDDLRTALNKGFADAGLDISIPAAMGQKKDTAVQQFVSELLNRLSSQEPIKLAGPLDLIAPKNGAAIRIFRVDGDGGTTNIEIINNITNTVEEVVTNIVNEGDTIITPSDGITGSIEVLTDVTVTVDSVAEQSGCDVTVTNTVTVTKTFKTITFASGAVTGAA